MVTNSSYLVRSLQFRFDYNDFTPKFFLDKNSQENESTRPIILLPSRRPLLITYRDGSGRAI